MAVRPGDPPACVIALCSVEGVRPLDSESAWGGAVRLEPGARKGRVRRGRHESTRRCAERVRAEVEGERGRVLLGLEHHARTWRESVELEADASARIARGWAAAVGAGGTGPPAPALFEDEEGMVHWRIEHDRVRHIEAMCAMRGRAPREIAAGSKATLVRLLSGSLRGAHVLEETGWVDHEEYDPRRGERMAQAFKEYAMARGGKAEGETARGDGRRAPGRSAGGCDERTRQAHGDRWAAPRRCGGEPGGGRDFVAGDVHGEFAKLEAVLEAVAFEPERDRLFSVGDLIDRGTDSDAAVAWLESARIAGAVRGNHEQMMIEAFAETYVWVDAERSVLFDSGEDAARLWMANGGGWWFARERGEDDERRWMKAMLALPYTMSVATSHGTVGIVHAQPGARSWSASVRECEQAGREGARRRTRAVWSRMRYGLYQSGIGEDRKDWAGGVDDARAVITGHTPVKAAEWRENVLNVDTGAFKPAGRMSLARIDCDPIVTTTV